MAAVIALVLVFAASAGAYVYWANSAFSGGLKSIGRADLDGSSPDQSFITGVNGACGVAVDDTHVYWGNSSSGTIGRANLDGSSPDQSFITTGTGICGVAVDGSHIYWATGGGGSDIGRANLDGTGIDPAFIENASPSVDVCGVAVDGAYVYWAGGVPGKIGRAPLGTQVPQQTWITIGTNNPCGVAVNATSIFWGNVNGTVGRADIDGSNVNNSFISGTGTNVCGVAVDATHLYWSNSTVGGPPPRTIGRASLDGSSPDNNFIAGTSGSCGVAVDALPLATSPPSSPPVPPSNRFTVEPRISCAGTCHVVLVKVTFNSAGRVIAEDAIDDRGQGATASKAKGGKKHKPLIKRTTKAVPGPGKLTLRIRLTSTARKALRKKSKVKLKIRFTFTPTGGQANSKIKSFTVRIKKKH